MPDFGSIQGGNAETLGATTASSSATLVTASSSANTKGAYAQLSAATSYDSAWVAVTINKPSTAAKYLVDIATGAASSETVIIANLLYNPRSSASVATAKTYLFPVSIPKGTRISARSQCSTTSSRTLQVEVVLIDGGMLSSCPFGVISSYGPDTSDSGGLSVDPGTTADTKGAYVEFSASTAYPIKWLAIGFGHNATGISATTQWLLDIAVGAGGSEQDILSNLYLCSGTTAVEHPTLFFPVNIPAGSRLASRLQCSVNTATERLWDIALYGVS